jgi:hypothetical protein
MRKGRLAALGAAIIALVATTTLTPAFGAASSAASAGAKCQVSKVTYGHTFYQWDHAADMGVISYHVDVTITVHDRCNNGNVDVAESAYIGNVKAHSGKLILRTPKYKTPISSKWSSYQLSSVYQGCNRSIYNCATWSAHNRIDIAPSQRITPVRVSFYTDFDGFAPDLPRMIECNMKTLKCTNGNDYS